VPGRRCVDRRGWGVSCGFEVRPPARDVPAWRVRVCPGYAITPQGDEILLADLADFDLARDLTAGAGPLYALSVSPGPGRCPVLGGPSRSTSRSGTWSATPTRSAPTRSAPPATRRPATTRASATPGSSRCSGSSPSPIPGPQGPARKLDRGAPTASRGAAPAAVVRTVPRRALSRPGGDHPAGNGVPADHRRPDRHRGPAGPVQHGSAAPADHLVAPPGPPREYRMPPSTVR
jgi:hypothetical protein